MQNWIFQFSNLEPHLYKFGQDFSVIFQLFHYSVHIHNAIVCSYVFWILFLEWIQSKGALIDWKIKGATPTTLNYRFSTSLLILKMKNSFFLFSPPHSNAFFRTNFTGCSPWCPFSLIMYCITSFDGQIPIGVSKIFRSKAGMGVVRGIITYFQCLCLYFNQTLKHPPISEIMQDIKWIFWPAPSEREHITFITFSHLVKTLSICFFSVSLGLSASLFLEIIFWKAFQCLSIGKGRQVLKQTTKCTAEESPQLTLFWAPTMFTFKNFSSFFLHFRNKIVNHYFIAMPSPMALGYKTIWKTLFTTGRHWMLTQRPLSAHLLTV